MGFSRVEAAQLLADCHRRCCICHRFAGVKLEIHHMIPRAEGGTDQISNGIPLCFDCHCEVEMYNDKHPKGRKYQPDELAIHKEQWISQCKGGNVQTPGPSNVGPIERLYEELRLNQMIAESIPNVDSGNDQYGSVGTEDRRRFDNSLALPFFVHAFKHCLEEGIFFLLPDELKTNVRDCYLILMQANQHAVHVPITAIHDNYQNARDVSLALKRRSVHAITAAIKSFPQFSE